MEQKDEYVIRRVSNGWILLGEKSDFFLDSTMIFKTLKELTEYLNTHE